MASFQSTVGLPPLSTIAATNHVPAATSGPDVAGVSSLSSSTAVEFRDARIKDPTPKKLKGQTSSLSGNFGILQMELGGHESSLERDELAKRASESTELAAMRAYQSGTNVSSMKRFVRVPDDPGSWDPYYASSSNNQASVPTTSPAAQVQPLAPSDVKQEQARLLTLLHSLPPASVVDQICKALSYFGGTPGTPPPLDGVFPRSELANGSGAAFVGWVAEIFPKLPNETTAAIKSIQKTDVTALSSLSVSNPDEPHAAAGAVLSVEAGPDAHLGSSTKPTGNVPATNTGGTTAPQVGKRRRGRPKGSKATKVRRDKGVKKGPIKDRKALSVVGGATNPETTTTRHEPQLGPRPVSIANGGHGEDSWVDVDDDNMLDVTGTVEDGLFFSADANAGLASDRGINSALGMRQVPEVRPGGTGASDTGINTNPPIGGAGKKRGRPKGSKNRPKAPVPDAPKSDSTRGITGPVTITPIPPPIVPGVAMPKKSKPKKPKPTSTQNTDVAGQPTQPGAISNNGQSTEQVQMQVAYEISDPPTSVQDSAVSLGTTKVAGATGNKRKRVKAPRQDIMITDPVPVPSSASGLSMPPMGDDEHAGHQSGTLHGILAPPKKQRKLADTNASVQGAANGSASPVPDISATQSTATDGFGQPETSLGADASIMPSLGPDSGSNGEFNTAAAFEALSSHMDQSTSVPLPGQHHHTHDHDLASLLNQQIPQQHRQSLQQQPLVTQKNMSLTPPFRAGADRMQGLGGSTQHQTQQQPHQQHLNQGQTSHQMQQLNSHQQASVHGSSSASSHNSAPPQMATTLSSGSLTPQQLPRPNRPSQSFYTQARPTNGNQFGQPLPQPLQHQQQHQQHQPQSHHQQQQKQQFDSQFQPQGQYTQPQQQQAFTSQQRHPPQNVGPGSPALLGQGNAHRSPQFASPNPSAIRPGSGTYASTTPVGTMGFNSSTYDQGRRQNTAGSPALAHTYGNPGPPSHTLGHQASNSFVATRPQQSPSTSHAQSVGGVTQGIQGFHGFDSPSLFDGISLDTAGGNAGLGLSNPATYGLGGVPRASGGAGSFGPPSSTNTFDADMGGHMRNRFYGVRR